MVLSEKIQFLSVEMQEFLDSIEHQPVLSIHGIRKRTKFIRSLLKLSPDRPVSLKKYLKSISGLIAPYRDAQVLLDTYYAIIDSSNIQLDPVLERTLTQSLYLTNPVPSESVIMEIHRLRSDFLQQFSHLNTDLSSADLSQRIEKTYHASQRAFSRVKELSDSETVHTWRKKSKRLWYQLRFVYGEIIEDPDHLVNQFDLLGKRLGVIHDLDIFSAHLENDEHSELQGIIKTRRHRLLQEALVQGNMLYANDSLRLIQQLSQMK